MHDHEAVHPSFLLNNYHMNYGVHGKVKKMVKSIQDKNMVRNAIIDRILLYIGLKGYLTLNISSNPI